MFVPKMYSLMPVLMSGPLIFNYQSIFSRRCRRKPFVMG